MDDSTFIIFLVVLFAFSFLMIASMWRIFTKAGQPGFFAIIPIVNVLVFMSIIKKPWWWLLLWFIPYLQLIWIIWGWNLLVKSFGKSEGYTIGCMILPFIFIPVLAFGASKYVYLNEKNEEQDIEGPYIQELIENSGGEGNSIIIYDECPACGTKISNTDKFCPDCGLSLD